MKKGKILQVILITAVVGNIITATTLAAPNTTSTKEYVSLAKIDSNKNIKMPKPILSSNNAKVTNGEGVNLNQYLNQVKNLKDGTIITRFKLDKIGSIQSLIGISNKNEVNHHFHIWTDGSQIGYEIRNESENIKGTVAAKLNKGINTLAFKVEKDVGYSIFLNGEKIKFDSSKATKFLKDMDNLNSIDIGKTERAGTANKYLMSGNIDFLNFYKGAISDEDIIKKTLETQKLEDAVLPENVFISETQKLFNTGDLNSKNFRIPSLLTTKSGTTIAAADIRNNHAGDSPANIDAGIRISKDGGKTWGQAKRVIDYPGNASVIDSSMLEDEQTGKVFLFITAFPENYGFPQCDKTATGFEMFENEQCMVLYDGAGTAGQKGQGNKYYIKPDGIVYNSNGEKTSYTVDANNNLYENGTKVSNTFLAEAPLKALGTAYLTIIESSDEGETWSDPKIISGMVKKDWMRFIGAGPGVGIQIKNGEKAGRLVYPLYYTNSKGFQSSAVMYSDDHGETWNLGESPNDSRDGHSENSDTIGSGNQLTEAQVVQMPDGQLKIFMRNTGSYVRIATSFDGGETWDSDVYEDKNLREPYCQLSVINYDGLIDGKKAIIFSNPNAASSRTNGTVRIGLLNENGTHSNGRTKYEIDWKYNQTVVPGSFAYSSISQLSNGNIGLFYEGATNLSVDFVQMNIDYLKTDLTKEGEAAKLASAEIINSKDFYNPPHKINLKLKFDQAVSLFGDTNFTATLDNKEVKFNVKDKTATEVTLEGTIPKDVSKGEYKVNLNPKSDLEIINSSGKSIDISKGLDTGISIKIGK
ncbi:sialidase family protein [Clostridium mediterraneense]|uniref:sialidase family protein n=1 Tax=Clostridium mediterraneense TaxID=1805472 RepID=UPI000834E19B|nr:sialidase family protein [Clostridium mediterraneense]